MNDILGGNYLKNNTNKSEIKVLAFDFWGVFADLDHPMYSYMKKNGVDAEKYSQPIHDLIIAHDLDKITEKEFLRKSSEVVGLELPYEVCRFALNEKLINQKLVRMVEKLNKRYQIILITNNSREYCQTYLFETGLDKLFHDKVISYDVGYRKPAQEMYEILIKKAKTKPSEILFIDDDDAKFPVAEKLGIKTLQYKRNITDKILDKSLV